MAAPLYTTDSGLLFHAGKILVITVGLPARGKTHVSRALERYLRWLGIRTAVVSLGDFRRKMREQLIICSSLFYTTHLGSLQEGEKSEETKRLRAKVSEGCEDAIQKFFEKQNGQVVIYDANNGTRAARTAVAEKFHKRGIHIIFLENVCDNEEIIEANIRSVKISSPDYKGWDPERAVEDYYTRIRDHEKYYEPVTETTWPFIRIINVGDKIEVNDIHGYLQSRIIFFLMNIHNKFRTIYFARSGQSLIEHSYKADSDLSPAGWEYANKLKDFVLERRAKALAERGMDPAERKLVIWTSARRRAHHTAWPFVTHAATYGPNAAGTPAMGSKPSSRVTTPLLHAVHNSVINALPPLSLPESAISESASIESVLMQKLGAEAFSARRESGFSPPPSSGSLPVSSPSVINVATPPVPSGALPPQRLFSSVKVVEKQQMSEINPGVWDELSPEEAEKRYPEEWERFLKDPYAFRAPRAESYHDLCVRLEPILVELEREQEDLLIIGHASVIRCILAYLIGLPSSEIPAVEVARGDLLEVRPASYGVNCQAYHFWDGPGRRGSTSSGQGSAKAQGLGLGIDFGQGTAGAKPKMRAGSVGANAKDKERERDKTRAGSMHVQRAAGTDWWAASKTAISMPSVFEEDGQSDAGAGGSGGAFGEPVAASDDSGPAVTEPNEVPPESQEDGGLDDEEHDDGNISDGSINFYENVAEDTRGKRRVDVEVLHDEI